MRGIQEALVDLRTAANVALLEREVEIDCLINALLSRSHICMLGTTGVGKTFLSDTFVALIRGIDGEEYFRSQLGRRSDPADILGPHSLPALNAGRWERDTTRKLARAKLAIIGEFWKAPDSARDDLLSILNEGIFYNGGIAEECPLSTLIVDSNEMPEPGHPLADRFTFWVITPPIAGRGNVLAMLQGAAERLRTVGTTTHPFVTPVIGWPEIRIAQHEVTQVKIPDEVLTALVDLRFKLNEAGIFPSERRLVSCLGVLQAEAYRAGRSEAGAEDMTLLAHVLWTKPTELVTVQRQIFAVSSPLDLKLLELSDAIEALDAEYSRALAISDAPTRKRRLIQLQIQLVGDVDPDTGALKKRGYAHDLVDTRDAAGGRTLALYAPLAARMRGLGDRLFDSMTPLSTSP